MTTIDIEKTIKNYRKLRFEDYKISYMILKPNAAKHYKDIIKTVTQNRFLVFNQYAVLDYETVNMALHIEQPSTMKYLLPITQMYKDFYGNYGILIAIAKRNITYENFCTQVVNLKKYLRDKFELPYIAFASELGETNEHQRLMIIAKNGSEVKKDKFNDEGTFMVFSPNEIHSPDGNVESTIKELELLMSMELFDKTNEIPKVIISSMKRYSTFEFLKDMLWYD